MEVRQARDPDSVLLGPSRARTLEVLQDAGRPLGVQEVAALVDLHVNTARFHLDGLVAAGLATRRQEAREGPGRPRAVYAPVANGAQVGQRSYRLLAEILTSFLAASVPEPSAAAVEAGKVWGRYFSERPAPFQQTSVEQGLDQLLQILADIGFDPEASGTAQEPRVRLRHCPFREVAKEHRDVVCSIHLGLMQGAVAEMQAPLTVEGLEPFVEPALCLASLRAAPATSPRPKRSRRSTRR